MTPARLADILLATAADELDEEATSMLLHLLPNDGGYAGSLYRLPNVPDGASGRSLAQTNVAAAVAVAARTNNPQTLIELADHPSSVVRRTVASRDVCPIETARKLFSVACSSDTLEARSILHALSDRFTFTELVEMVADVPSPARGIAKRLARRARTLDDLQLLRHRLAHLNVEPELWRPLAWLAYEGVLTYGEAFTTCPIESRPLLAIEMVAETRAFDSALVDALAAYLPSGTVFPEIQRTRAPAMGTPVAARLLATFPSLLPTLIRCGAVSNSQVTEVASGDPPALAVQVLTFANLQMLDTPTLNNLVCAAGEHLAAGNPGTLPADLLTRIQGRTLSDAALATWFRHLDSPRPIIAWLEGAFASQLPTSSQVAGLLAEPELAFETDAGSFAEHLIRQGALVRPELLETEWADLLIDACGSAGIELLARARSGRYLLRRIRTTVGSDPLKMRVALEMLAHSSTSIGQTLASARRLLTEQPSASGLG